MICDYYLKLLLEPDEEDRIISFEEWKRENQKRLRGKSEEEKSIIWQQEEIVGKKKKEIVLSKDKAPCDFYPNPDDLQNLPENSTLIKISFTLKKPYTSKGEGEFHIIKEDYQFSWNDKKKLAKYLKNKHKIQINVNNIDIKNNIITFKDGNIHMDGNFAYLEINGKIKDVFLIEKRYDKKLYSFRIFENPIVRDKFTGLPIVKPSTWKGHLRFAAGKVERKKEEKKKIIRRLFGSESEDEKALKGRLYFFPTFFKDEADKDVITPLKRDTRTPARGPINLEVMKPDSKGEFYILYVPYPKGKDFKEEQIKEDLKFLAEALEQMFYTYGFSAKKTSGFGVIEELKEENIEVYPEDKKEIFSILYTKVNKNVNQGEEE